MNFGMEPIKSKKKRAKKAKLAKQATIQIPKVAITQQQPSAIVV